MLWNGIKCKQKHRKTHLRYKYPPHLLNTVNVSVQGWSGCPCISPHLVLSYLSSSLSLQQDSDEVRLRDGAGGTQDILWERCGGLGEDVWEPEAGEVHSLALADERGVAEYQLHHCSSASHPNSSVWTHHSTPLWSRPALWVLTAKWRSNVLFERLRKTGVK